MFCLFVVWFACWFVCLFVCRFVCLFVCVRVPFFVCIFSGCFVLCFFVWGGEFCTPAVCCSSPQLCATAMFGISSPGFRNCMAPSERCPRTWVSCQRARPHIAFAAAGCTQAWQPCTWFPCRYSKNLIN